MAEPHPFGPDPHPTAGLDGVRVVVQRERRADEPGRVVDPGHARAEAADEPIEQGVEHLALVAEVVVQQAGGQARFVGDGDDGGAGVSLFGQHAGERVDDLGSPLRAVARSPHHRLPSVFR